LGPGRSRTASRSIRTSTKYYAGVFGEHLGCALPIDGAKTLFAGTGVIVEQEARYEIIDVAQFLERKPRKDEIILATYLSQFKNPATLEREIQLSYLDSLKRAPNDLKKALEKSGTGLDSETAAQTLETYEGFLSDNPKLMDDLIGNWEKERMPEIMHGRTQPLYPMEKASLAVQEEELFQIFLKHSLQTDEERKFVEFIHKAGTESIPLEKGTQAIDQLIRAAYHDPKLVAEWKAANRQSKEPKYDELFSFVRKTSMAGSARDLAERLRQRGMELIDHSEKAGPDSLYSMVSIPDALVTVTGRPTSTHPEGLNTIEGALDVKTYTEQNVDEWMGILEGNFSWVNLGLSLEGQSNFVNIAGGLGLEEITYTPAEGHLQIIRVPRGISIEKIDRLGKLLQESEEQVATDTTVSDGSKTPHTQRNNIVIQEIPFSREEIDLTCWAIVSKRLEAIVKETPDTEKTAQWNRVVDLLKELKDPKLWGINR